MFRPSPTLKNGVPVFERVACSCAHPRDVEVMEGGHVIS